MSCDWDVECATCGRQSGMSDANHEVELVRALCRLGPILKMVALSLRTIPQVWGQELRVRDVGINLDFFAEHGDHQLRPRNEYGELDRDCGAEWYCSSCGKIVRCARREHPGQPGNHYHVVEGGDSVHPVGNGVSP